jgi:hypothetical protein
MGGSYGKAVQTDLRGFQVVDNYGGASRDRTDDLIVANDALSQLSYSPESKPEFQPAQSILPAFPNSDQRELKLRFALDLGYFRAH